MYSCLKSSTVFKWRSSNKSICPEPFCRAPDTGAEGSADVVALQQDLADALGLNVQLTDRNGKGELTIRYGTLEQLDDLCRRLMRG